jgi:hypothetical protein
VSTRQQELAKQVELAEAAIIRLLVVGGGVYDTFGLVDRAAELSDYSSVNLAFWELISRRTIRFTSTTRRTIALETDIKKLLLRDQMLLRMAPQFEPAIAALVAKTIAEVLQQDFGIGPHGEIATASA